MSEEQQTPSDREAAVAEFDRLMATEHGMRPTASSPAPEPGPVTPDDGAAVAAGESTTDAVGIDVQALAGQLAEALPGTYPDAKDQVWKGEAKAKMVALGLPERQAHMLAYEGARETVEKVLAGGQEDVSSTVANPDPSPAGRSETGVSLSESLREALADLDGPAAQELGHVIQRMDDARGREVAEMRAQLDMLRTQSRSADADRMTKVLTTARAELRGRFPELDSQAHWDQQVAPRMAKALDLADGDAAKALSLACDAAFGSRAGQVISGSGGPKTTSVGTVSRDAGSRAPSKDARAAELAKAIFNGASEADVMRLARD